MALEKEEEWEYEEEPDNDVENVEFDGSWGVRVGPGSPAVLLVVGRGRRVPGWPYYLAAPVAHRQWARVRIPQTHDSLAWLVTHAAVAIN